MKAVVDEFDLDAEEQREADKKLRMQRRAEEEVADIKAQMSTVQGRRFVARLIEDTGVYRSSFDQNAMKMATLEGNRRVGIDLRDLARAHCKKEFLLMEQESMRDE